MYSTCEFCTRRFQRRYDWQTLCSDCYQLRQQHGGKDAWIRAMDLQIECDRLRRELDRARRPPCPPPYVQKSDPAERALLDHVKSNPKAWLMLVHPDKHDGNATATEVTRLILGIRK